MGKIIIDKDGITATDDKAKNKRTKEIKGWLSFLSADALFALGINFCEHNDIALSSFLIVASAGVLIYCLAVVMEDDK